MAALPFVSVVTPFYNTAPYLAACIESVLAQTHSHFEYLLVDNKSTDGSREIAARYAARDPRIRLLDNDAFVGQLANFNGALERIAPESRYVKMVLADDVVFPECLARLVAAGEAHPSAGLVAAFYLYGDRVDGSGIPLAVSCLPGREALRLIFLAPCFLVGTPTTVLYRAGIVRTRRPFFAPAYHADTEAAYEILLEHDLAFVHQVLSFVRTDNESISSSVRDFYPIGLDNLIVVERFGRRVLSPEEFDSLRSRARREYYGLLGAMALRFRGRRFWSYHRGGLATLGRDLRWRDVAPWTAAELLHVVLNPENTMRRGLAWWRKRRTPAPDVLTATSQAASSQQ
jgi:glycosyltransferase involved in cell wall biosynthesis